MYRSSISFYPERPMSRGGYFKRILIVLGLLALVFLPDFFFGSQWHSRNLSLWVLGAAGGLVLLQSLFREVKVALTLDYGQEQVLVSSRTLLRRKEWAVSFQALRFTLQEATPTQPIVLELQGEGQPALRLSEEDGFPAKQLRAIAEALQQLRQQYGYAQ